MLREQGFNAFVIVGGFAAWRKAGHETECGSQGRSGETANIFVMEPTPVNPDERRSQTF